MTKHWMKTAALGGCALAAVMILGCERRTAGGEFENREQAAAEEETQQRYGQPAEEQAAEQESKEELAELQKEVNDYRQEARQELGKLQQRIDELDKKAAGMTGEMKALTQKELSELRRDWQKLQTEIDGMKANSSQEFEQSKNVMDRKLESFEKSLDAVGEGTESKSK